MENDIDTAAIARVWARVNAADAAPAAAPAAANGAQDALEALLRDFIADEAADSAAYARMARMARGTCLESVFRAVSADEARHEKQLQAEYYLLSGSVYCPVPAPACELSLLAAVRARYLGELSGAAAYEKAAGETADEGLGALFAALAADERRHACRMRAAAGELIRC